MDINSRDRGPSVAGFLQIYSHVKYIKVSNISTILFDKLINHVGIFVDSNLDESSMYDSNDASGAPQDWRVEETTPEGKKRLRSTSDQSLLESPEKTASSKPTKSQNNKRPRIISTPSREPLMETPVQTSSLNARNAKDLRQFLHHRGI